MPLAGGAFAGFQGTLRNTVMRTRPLLVRTQIKQGVQSAGFFGVSSVDFRAGSIQNSNEIHRPPHDAMEGR